MPANPNSSGLNDTGSGRGRPVNLHSLIVFATSPPALFHPRTLSTYPFDAARAPIAPGSPCPCCAIKQCCDENRLTVRPTLCAARCEPLRSLERRKESGCAPGPSLTGDRRHGRGCELRRCSGRLTSGPGAPNGASRHRANQENSAARLLLGRAARSGCHRSDHRLFRLHAAQASTSSARRYLTSRLADL